MLHRIRADSLTKKFFVHVFCLCVLPQNHLYAGSSDAMVDLSDSQRALIARALEQLQRKKQDEMKRLIQDQDELDCVVASHCIFLLLVSPLFFRLTKVLIMTF